MPTAAIKSFAKKSGKPVADVEGYWDEAIKAAKDKNLTGEHVYAYAMGIVKKRCGITEALTFKEFMIIDEAAAKKEKKKEKKEPATAEPEPLAIKPGDRVQVCKAFKLGDEDVSEGEVYTVKDVDEHGNLKLDNHFGPHYHDKYFSKRNFKKVET